MRKFPSILNINDINKSCHHTDNWSYTAEIVTSGLNRKWGINIVCSLPYSQPKRHVCSLQL